MKKRTQITESVKVAAFAAEMRAKLAANRHKNGWDAEDKWWLVARLVEEVSELIHAVNGSVKPGYIRQEAADVANFAMMIADVTDAAGPLGNGEDD